jgi:hypothetical protein
MMICPTGAAKYFSQEDWTVDSALIGFAKLDFWRNEYCRDGGAPSPLAGEGARNAKH